MPPLVTLQPKATARCNDRGATAVEYGLMVALTLPSSVSSRSPARNRLSTLFDTVATSV